MNYEEAILNSARELGYIDQNGNLVPLDSVGMVELVVAIEDACSIRVPMTEFSPEDFRSIDTVATLIRSVAEKLPVAEE